MPVAGKNSRKGSALCSGGPTVIGGGVGDSRCPFADEGMVLLANARKDDAEGGRLTQVQDRGRSARAAPCRCRVAGQRQGGLRCLALIDRGRLPERKPVAGVSGGAGTDFAQQFQDALGRHVDGGGLHPHRRGRLLKRDCLAGPRRERPGHARRVLQPLVCRTKCVGLPVVLVAGGLNRRLGIQVPGPRGLLHLGQSKGALDRQRPHHRHVRRYVQVEQEVLDTDIGFVECAAHGRLRHGKRGSRRERPHHRHADRRPQRDRGRGGAGRGLAARSHRRQGKRASRRQRTNGRSGRCRDRVDGRFDRERPQRGMRGNCRPDRADWPVPR